MTSPTPPATPPASDPPAAPAADDKAKAEEGYWAKLKSTVNEVVDERLKEARQGLGTQRTGRTTIFDIIGDFMWGPAKNADKK